MKKDNMLNKTFGRLKVLYKDGVDNHRRVMYCCECECGNVIMKNICIITIMVVEELKSATDG